MLTKIKGVLLNRLAVTYSFFILMLLASVTVITPYSTELNVVVLLWGGLLGIYDLFTERRFLKSRHSIFLVVFTFLSILTVFVNYSMNLVGNIKTYAYAALLILVIYPYEEGYSKEKITRDLNGFNAILAMFSTIVGFGSLITFVFSIKFRVGDILQGFWEPTLWGLYRNPNTGGMVSVAGIIAIAFLWYMGAKSADKKTGIFKKVCFIIGICVNYLYLILCASRGAMLTAFAALIITVFFLVLRRSYHFAEGNHTGKTVAVFSLMAVIAGLGSGALGYMGSEGIKKGLSYLPGYISSFTSFTSDDPKNPSGSGDKKDPVNLDRNINSDNISTGRFEIWETGLQTLKFHPLLGCGSDNIGIMREKVVSENASSHIKTNNMHNGYLQILVGNGVLGFAAFAAFYALTIKDMASCFFGKMKRRINPVFVFFLFLMIAAISVDALFENILLINWSYAPVVLWFYLRCFALYFETMKKEPIPTVEKAEGTKNIE